MSIYKSILPSGFKEFISNTSITVFDFEEYCDADSIENNTPDIDIVDSAVTGLQSLGYKKQKAVSYTKQAMNSGCETVEDIIKYALALAHKERST